MATDYTSLAQQMVAPIYDTQEQGVNTQISQAENDPYYSELLKGLEATKARSFGEIEGRAAGRGVAYGNIPSQQQAAYLGEKYLPAVAEVKKTQLDRINALKQTLVELRAKRASAVLDQANMLQDRDWKAAEAEKDRAFKASQASLDRGTPKPVKYTRMKDQSGGWTFLADGVPTSLANYANGTGVNLATALAGSSNEGDAQMLNDYQMMGGANANSEAQARFANKYPWLF